MHAIFHRKFLENFVLFRRNLINIKKITLAAKRKTLENWKKNKKLQISSVVEQIFDKG